MTESRAYGALECVWDSMFGSRTITSPYSERAERFDSDVTHRLLLAHKERRACSTPHRSYLENRSMDREYVVHVSGYYTVRQGPVSNCAWLCRPEARFPRRPGSASRGVILARIRHRPLRRIGLLQHAHTGRR